MGHLACQRVFWLCDFAGEPGAETTRFTNAGYDCPGDDDLEHVLGAEDLVEALESTFRIVEGCLDRWTLPMLDEVVRRPEWDASWVHAHGAVIQRVFAHDVSHITELERDAGPGRAAADRPLGLTPRDRDAGPTAIIAVRAPVAQWIERRPPEPKVAGSNPVGRATATFSGSASANPCAYADGVSRDTMLLPATTIRS